MLDLISSRVHADALEILVAAFEGDHALRCLYPEDNAYHASFPGFALALGGRAFEGGAVDVEGDGAALWLAPGQEVDGAAVSAWLEATIPADRLESLAAGMEIQGGFHPSEPHWYVPWVGIRPEAQGRGIGAALLLRGLARADGDGLPAYLEATNRRNAALYARHGFEALGVVDAPGYPEIIPMWRPARNRRAVA
jgi:ribosomal protein S18 acetylase RimI-like enzyme